MRITRLASWMGPTYVGSTLAAWAACGLIAVFGANDPSWPGWVTPWVKFVGLAAIATPTAGAIATAMLVIDVLLLKLKVRMLPQGAVNGVSAFAATSAIAVSFYFFRPTMLGGFGMLALTTLLPILLGGTGSRLLFSQKIDKLSSDL